jgi:azurin
MKILRLSLFLLAFSVVFSCGNEKEKKEEKEEIKIGSQKKEKTTEESKTIKIGLTGNDLMQFDKSEIKVKAGQEVTLTLRHIGKMDISIMGHNFVLLKQGISIPEFSVKASEAGESADWIPDNGEEVLAHTKMIGGGQSTSVTFTAPEPGTYDFICSFPGHSALMKGKFIVEG